jgi:hypothetical protein
MSGSFAPLNFGQFQAPDIVGMTNTMQTQSLNAMREGQLMGDEREKNNMRALFADPNFNPNSPDAAQRILAVAPRTGHATYTALLRGYADRRAAEASVRAGAASDRAAALSVRQAQAADLDRSIKLTQSFRDMLPTANAENYPVIRAAAIAAVPSWTPSWPETYDANAVRALMQKADDSLREQAERNKPPADFTLSPGQTRFNAAGQPIASSEVRDPAREVKIRDIMDTQNIPRSIAVGIVDGVLRPIQDPVSGQTRLFNLANNTFDEFTPAGAPTPNAPAPNAPAPTAPAPTATPGGEPPVNAMTAPTTAAAAPASLAAGPRENAFQLPAFPPPRTHMEAEQQRALRNMAVEIEKNRVEAARRRAEQPERVEEARQTTAATARAQADVRREDAPAVAVEEGMKTGAQTTARLEAEEAVKRRQDAERLDEAVRELRNIVRPGGLLQRSTGSGAGRLLDIAGEAVGMSSRGAQAAAELAPIADMVLKMVPRFEGPQSDADRKAYESAAGRLADPTIPNETRLAAARQIIRLMENRRGQFTTNPIAPTGGTAGASPTSSAASAIPPPPSGMSQSDWSRLWGVMKPEERALWQN